MALTRRDTLMVTLLAGSLLGIVALVGLLGWFLWRESVVAEEERLRALAQRLGEHTEGAIIDARSFLQRLNESSAPRCQSDHLQAMQAVTFSRPWVRAVGYWQAAERLCGTGFAEGAALRPPQASRIYDNGVIAWWPSESTQVGGRPLFLMRFGNHDIAMDPQLLLNAGLLEEQRAGLWVEGLLMASTPENAELPPLSDLPPGLRVDRARGQLTARFSLGTLFPIDVVAVQPLSQFYERYLPTLIAAGLLALLLVALWVLLILHVSRRHLSLAGELRNAIDRREILVQYQPIIDLHSGNCVGAEALVRWCREDGELVSPDIFVPMAEEGGFITDLTLAVLERVLEETRELIAGQDGFSINLNLSPQDLETDRLFNALQAGLQAHHLPARAIKLELTERALLDTDITRRRLVQLRQQGHPLAIDDFGTGYSSLSYLQSFELDILKIDKAFVDTIDTPAVTSAVIEHVVDMARSLGLDMVAEGVESRQQMEWLRGRGVHFAQGFYFSKPLGIRELEDFLRHRP
ncbi:EAL domain-containing protein [Haliea atlantica]